MWSVTIILVLFWKLWLHWTLDSLEINVMVHKLNLFSKITVSLTWFFCEIVKRVLQTCERHKGVLPSLLPRQGVISSHLPRETSHHPAWWCAATPLTSFRRSLTCLDLSVPLQCNSRGQWIFIEKSLLERDGKHKWPTWLTVISPLQSSPLLVTVAGDVNEPFIKESSPFSHF